MNKAQLERFRQRLLEMKGELDAIEEAAGDAAGPVELDQARVGRLSRMDAMQAQAMAQESARRRQRHLAAIEGALRRIDKDEYGYCFACGEDIDIRRLDADPTNTRCIRCAKDR